METNPQKGWGEKPTIIHGLLRNGHSVRYRRMTDGEKLGKWTFLGWHNEVDRFFPNGDPEMWDRDGKWNEDGKPSKWDIVRTIGIEQ